jgi:hypothetical protein
VLTMVLMAASSLALASMRRPSLAAQDPAHA